MSNQATVVMKKIAFLYVTYAHGDTGFRFAVFPKRKAARAWVNATAKQVSRALVYV